MNKNAIKKFATQARRELISRVSQRALKYGISDKEVGNPHEDSVNGYLLSSTEKKQRAALIAQIKEKGYDQVMEEVAYTWFNRFSALRFMEVNGYIPTRVRVFTDENNAFKPQILTEAIHMELDGLDREKVYAYKEANDNDELYKYLLITQCNALNSVLPGMFQKIADYTELLFPDNLLREGSVVQQMIELIPEEDWKEQVQIIGWLYQYYNSEKKDAVFAALKKNVKITKENIPAATQLFTPDWIVRYMVENSLGRLWVEGHPNDELKSHWKYYLEEAEQEPEVQVQLAEIRKEYATLTPNQLKVIDPCSGSGHILAYMFDVLMQIYESYGYTTREAVTSIVENNLYGLDIDDRAAQLAYFSVMMKACQYDKRFLRRNVQPHVYAIVESNHVDPNVVDYFCNGDAKLKEAMDTIIDELHDAKEYGSIITVSQQDWDALYDRFQKIETSQEISLYQADILALRPLVQVAEVLSKKYDVVVTNPPYMASSGMRNKLADYLKKFYPASRADLYAVFIERCGFLLKPNGFQAMITQHTWMFLGSYEKMRKNLLTKSLVNLLHFGIRAFEEIGNDVVQTCAFVFQNTCCSDRYSSFCRLVNVKDFKKKSIAFFDKSLYFTQSVAKFNLIPGGTYAYWCTDSFIQNFKDGMDIESFAEFTGSQNITGNNEKYLRYFWEIDDNKIGTSYWVFYAKGGDYRKYYGNLEMVVDWRNNARYFYSLNKTSNLLNEHFWFKEGITYSAVTSRGTGFRYLPPNCIFDKGGPSIAVRDHLSYLLPLLNSKVAEVYFQVLNPSINLQVKDIKALPILLERENEIEILSKETLSIAKQDWDSFETSFGFRRHPLIQNVATIEEAFSLWKKQQDFYFYKVLSNETNVNKIFAETYHLNNMDFNFEDRDIPVRKADLSRDIRSFISYAVGCLLGRYSLDMPGLAYAGGTWDLSKYQTCLADPDNIIPICDDEYFQDDMVGRFVSFVETVYGKEHIEENLAFIASGLDGKGQPKEVIRNYFINDFYKDHCKMYKKRPIYWLFDSGKKNGFKCLIYMHRYQPDTIARIRTDYVHEQQARYRTAIADLENRMAGASTSERVKLNKQLKKLNDQASEIHTYEEKIHHLADQMIAINLDDGVKVNYAKFQDVLAKIK